MLILVCVTAPRAQECEKNRRADECHDGADRQLPRTYDGARDEIRCGEHCAACEGGSGCDEAMIARLEGESHGVWRDEADEANRAGADNGDRSQHGAGDKEERAPSFKLKAHRTCPELTRRQYI